MIYLNLLRGRQDEKTLPNWIVCLAYSQSTHCSGKILCRKRVWQTERELEGGLNRQETLKEGQTKEEGWGEWHSGQEESVGSFTQKQICSRYTSWNRPVIICEEFSNTVGKMNSSSSVLHKTQVHIRDRSKWLNYTHSPNTPLRLLTYYREKKSQCLFGKVLVLDTRGGAGRRQMLFHTPSSPLPFSSQHQTFFLPKFWDFATMMQPVVFVLFWSAGYESSPQRSLRCRCTTHRHGALVPIPPPVKLCVCVRKMGRSSEGG